MQKQAKLGLVSAPEAQATFQTWNAVQANLFQATGSLCGIRKPAMHPGLQPRRRGQFQFHFHNFIIFSHTLFQQSRFRFCGLRENAEQRGGQSADLLSWRDSIPGTSASVSIRCTSTCVTHCCCCRCSFPICARCRCWTSRRSAPTAVCQLRRKKTSLILVATTGLV